MKLRNQILSSLVEIIDVRTLQAVAAFFILPTIAFWCYWAQLGIDQFYASSASFLEFLLRLTTCLVISSAAARILVYTVDIYGSSFLEGKLSRRGKAFLKRNGIGGEFAEFRYEASLVRIILEFRKRNFSGSRGLVLSVVSTMAFFLLFFGDMSLSAMMLILAIFVVFLQMTIDFSQVVRLSSTKEIFNFLNEFRETYRSETSRRAIFEAITDGMPRKSTWRDALRISSTKQIGEAVSVRDTAPMQLPNIAVFLVLAAALLGVVMANSRLNSTVVYFGGQCGTMLSLTSNRVILKDVEMEMLHILIRSGGKISVPSSECAG